MHPILHEKQLNLTPKKLDARLSCFYLYFKSENNK